MIKASKTTRQLSQQERDEVWVTSAIPDCAAALWHCLPYMAGVFKHWYYLYMYVCTSAICTSVQVTVNNCTASPRIKACEYYFNYFILILLYFYYAQPSPESPLVGLFLRKGTTFYLNGNYKKCECMVPNLLDIHCATRWRVRVNGRPVLRAADSFAAKIVLSFSRVGHGGSSQRWVSRRRSSSWQDGFWTCNAFAQLE